MKRGPFITFEGPDKAGKTTQLALFRDFLDAQDIDYLFTREPGGCDISEQIRTLVLDPRNDMNPVCEALLYAAARSELVQSVLLPALETGQTVVCDRYVDSSIAYQGYGRQMGQALIESINAPAVAGLMPDLTFYLNIDPAQARLRAQGPSDRMEDAGDEFAQRVHQGYLALCAQQPHRFVVVDATQSIEAVHAAIVSAYRARFGA